MACLVCNPARVGAGDDFTIGYQEDADMRRNTVFVSFRLGYDSKRLTCVLEA